MKIIIALLGLTAIASGELIESKKFLFSANPSLKLQFNEARHPNGAHGAFMAYDEKTDLGFVIVVHQNMVLRDILKDSPNLLPEVIEANLKSYTGGMRLVPGSLKQTPGRTLGKNSISYSFTTLGVRSPGQRTFHNGVLLFHHNAFYTIEIHSNNENTDRTGALTQLLSSFKLLNPE
jgi:hypothetical protein